MGVPWCSASPSFYWSFIVICWCQIVDCGRWERLWEGGENNGRYQVRELHWGISWGCHLFTGFILIYCDFLIINRRGRRGLSSLQVVVNIMLIWGGTSKLVIVTFFFIFYFLDKRILVDAMFNGNITRYINHRFEIMFLMSYYKSSIVVIQIVSSSLSLWIWRFWFLLIIVPFLLNRPDALWELLRQ